MEQDDDRLDALLLELRYQRVRGLLVGEGDVRIPAGETISGVCSSVMPMMPTLTAGK